MIIFLTGTTGSGKTDTAWALVSALPELVFLDCDWFASRSPFSWKRAEDVESVYRSVRSQIAFHLGEGRTNFVVTLTLEMAGRFREECDAFAAFQLPICAFRLVASNDTIKARITGRDRIQKAEELENALQQHAEFDRLCADATIFSRIETDGLNAYEVAAAIVERSRPEISR
jgi:AAA domain